MIARDERRRVQAREASRRRRARDSEKRVLKGGLAVDDTAVSVLALRNLIPITAAESDFLLLDALGGLIDRLAEAERHPMTEADSGSVILKIDVSDMLSEEATGCDPSSLETRQTQPAPNLTALGNPASAKARR